MTPLEDPEEATFAESAIPVTVEEWIDNNKPDVIGCCAFILAGICLTIFFVCFVFSFDKKNASKVDETWAAMGIVTYVGSVVFLIVGALCCFGTKEKGCFDNPGCITRPLWRLVPTKSMRSAAQEQEEDFPVFEIETEENQSVEKDQYPAVDTQKE
jgi:hypothetical protein